MSLSTDEESSESSGNEYLVTPGKLNLDSTFFQKKSSSTKASTSYKDDDDSSDSDDDFVCDNKDSNALLAEVMKNLENANKTFSYDERETKNSSQSRDTAKSSPTKDNVLSDEITNLLLQGESGVSTSSFRAADDDEITEEKKPLEYTIPKEGVDITLPGSATMLFGRNKKKRQNLEDVLRKKMNHRLRKNQIFVHKVGLMCWLAHGFHLNVSINNEEILSTALSLVPPGSYPKGRVDLKYIEQFTKWFKNLFKLEFKDVGDRVERETLLVRLKKKKIHNYREMVLLYAATLRAIGLNCRLVVSLCPPALKLRQDQLFQSSESKEKKCTSKVKKTVRRKNKDSKSESDESKPKIVPENSGEMRENAKLNAKKRAADVLSKFANNRSKKSIKSLMDEKKIAQSPEKRMEESKSPPKVRQLRSRAVQQNSQSVKTDKSKKIEDKKELKGEQLLGKRTTANTSAKTEKPSTSTITDSDSDDEVVIKVPSKKKKTLASEEQKSPKKKKTNAKNVEKNHKSDSSDEEFKPEPQGIKKKLVASKNKMKKVESEDDDSDEAFEKKPPVKRKRIDHLKKGKSSDRDSIDRQILSSDDEQIELVDAKGAQNIWVEVYVESEESWISVSVVDDKIHCVSEIYKKAPKPVLYVIAWNSVGSLKDVTRRYCPHWLTITRKQRVDESWWVETLSPWLEKSTALSRAEDEMLLQRELEQPLPKTVGECKGHPLYALARHLLKFEAIYPPDSIPLGHLRTGEAIYSRYCVHTLCSRETWIKKARVVKPAQEAYKIVKSMPKYDKLSGIKLADQPLELFGKWQTTQYVPPVAKDGKVPRNEYGNVDLFKACMLPIGTVHINLPALNRVARKLNIDCVPAVVGFNFGARGALPAIEGYVVCKEFEETLRAAWEEDQIESAKRAVEKREKRIYGNWKKLIKGLFIRERLAARYDFNNEADDDDDDYDEKPSSSTKKSNKKTAETKKAHGKKSKTS